ncbi:glycoside hydrolase family 97 protein [Winogradskyella echinorum]|uniref:Glycoside hydrolase family 97 protein n=1 Tax=Winogradskyella echinorum TaxID=538189 RepID=A0ABR6XXX7_9FLAO|nr:glycoside hydrolase family 97 protein [Winogradskyella echinorum]MBC3845331.1 glycoside hydrolase family 97 protein [Winogradskyella echinorum]MBC5749679.1 glycoside hydrolase family 97 protein [Winogradskyella echinorum]
MKIKFIPLLIIAVLYSCTKENAKILDVSSPNKEVEVNFNINKEGKPFYTVKFNNKTVVDTSYLGFDFKDIEGFDKNFKINNTSTSSFNETWQMPWGEQLDVVNNYNELKVELQENNETARLMTLVFKVYDDGIGFRYEFPEQANFKGDVYVNDEHTEFNLTEDYKTFWIPGDWDIYEHLYNTTKLSEIDALQFANHKNLAQTYIPENAVNTPVTMVGSDGTHLSFHEAALIDYSGMTLKVDTENLNLKSNLVGSENTDYKVKKTVPFNTPWRTIQISDNASDLIESKLIVNLNEPNKLGDVSWFKPVKYTGVWWEMHLGKSSWDYGMTQDMSTWTDGGKSHGRHGATTENVKNFIDFSAKNNIGGVLVEGWNTGWEHWIGFEDREGVFDFVTPYPDYDIDEVTRYAKEKGVEIIMHHETSAATETYEKQQDTAYALMQKYGMHAVKSGYVGKILPKGEYHHGQYMVNQYNNAAIKAAKYEVAVNAHEPIKATGLRRTYPNIISREGLRGQEFNAWASDGGNLPEHLPIVAFTRMLSGPIDFTPGIFNIKFDEYKKDNQVNTTIAQQLALYVVIYSPVQMAADLVEHYEANPKPLQFIRDVGVDWQQTKVLNGEVGDYVTIARQERGTGNWFVGGITDENARTIDLTFDFLDDNQNYEVIIYKDGENAHWDNNPLDITIEKIDVTKGSKLSVNLAEGGGFAMSLIKK